MKRIFISLLFCFSLFANAQTSVLEPGVYSGNAKGQTLKLRVFEDNKYEMAVFSGKYVIENDTITFMNREPNTSAFKISVNQDAPFSSSLKIKFKSDGFIYGIRNVYIGTQKEDNAVIEYKELSDLVNKRSYSYSGNKDLKIDIDKTKYLYFVDLNVSTEAVVTKFQIDENYNEIAVEYTGGGMEGIELRGVINKETGKISVMEGRRARDLVEFEKVDPNGVKTEEGIKPLAIANEKDWKKNHGFTDENEFDSSYLEQRPKAAYTFKHTIAKTYSEALKSIAKTPEKFLVIVTDDRKQAKKEFDEFIKNHESRLSGRMYNGYDAKADNFNFYFATDKDKALISNFKVKDKPALIFVNSDGQLIYHTSGNINDKSDLFESYYSVYQEVQRANEHFKLDKLVANKKTTTLDFKKAFAAMVKANGNRNYDYSDNYAVDSTAVEAVEAVAAAVDTAAAVVDYPGYYGDYLHVEDPENLYSIKTRKEVLLEKWKAIIDYYTKNNTYDDEFVTMCKGELLGNGFFNRLYPGKNLVGETDFRMLDYLYKNYNEIVSNEEKKRKQEAEINEYGDEYATPELGYLNNFDGIANTLSRFFGERTDEASHLHRSNRVKSIEYYKTFLQLSGYSLSDFSNYLTQIKETNPNNYSAYYKEYGDYFDSVSSRNSSIIESLDAMFANQTPPFQDWKEFKYSFAMLANNTAWAVVETKSNDANTIQTALKWSEASLVILKNDIHCLDTLAQLYYKNNQKEKAIATEQKAIDNLNPKDTVRKQEYGEILQKMKDGTY